MNPDFGQVEADPAEVNLSAFETFFDERRPFFVEGANLLTGNVDNYFYSRRIGAPPQGDADGDFVDYPPTTTILGAAKLTGRLASGTRSACSAPSPTRSRRAPSARAQFGRVRVAPRTAYGVARVEQEFGPPGSTVGVHGHDRPPPVRARRSAGRAADAQRLHAQRRFGAALRRLRDAGLPRRHVRGRRARRDPAAPAVERALLPAARRRLRAGSIRRARRCRARRAASSFERQNGRHWLWEAATSFDDARSSRPTTSAGSPPATACGRRASSNTARRRPGRWFGEYSHQRRTGPASGTTAATCQTIGASRSRASSFTWPNFWETELIDRASSSGAGHAADARRAVDGAAAARGDSALEVETQRGVADAGRRSSWPTAGTRTAGWSSRSGPASPCGPAPQWQLSVSPSYEREVDTQQYVTTLAGRAARRPSAAATSSATSIGRRIPPQVRLNYTFKPDLNLDFYGEPFAASGRYDRFGELAARAQPRCCCRSTRPATSLADQRLQRALVPQQPRAALGMARRAARLYLVWQQDRETEETLATRASVARHVRLARRRAATISSPSRRASGFRRGNATRGQRQRRTSGTASGASRPPAKPESPAPLARNAPCARAPRPRAAAP